MGPRMLVVTVFVALLCVTQSLKCNFCKSVDKDFPFCDQTEEQECSMDLSYCIRIRMHEPAYGEVRRCASAHECEVKVPPLVERQCCSTDLCN